DERLLRGVIGVTVIAEDMERGGVHTSLMAPDEATEGFAVTLPRPVEVGVLVSHSGNYKVTNAWTTAGPLALGQRRRSASNSFGARVAASSESRAKDRAASACAPSRARTRWAPAAPASDAR